MRETLLIILLAVGFVGSVSVYFINGRSFARSAGGICAVLIACVLSYLLFIPLRQGVSIYSLTPRIVALAFLPLAAVLLGQGIYYFVSNRPVSEAAAEVAVSERKANPSAKKQFSFFAKGRMTGKERLAAMLSGIEEEAPKKEPKPVKEKPEKKDKKKEAKKEVKAEQKSEPVKEIAPVEETAPLEETKPDAEAADHSVPRKVLAEDESAQEADDKTVLTGRERLAAMLESAEIDARAVHESEEQEAPEEVTDEPVAPEEVMDEPVVPEEVMDEPVAPKETAGEPVAPEEVMDEPVVPEEAMDEPVVPDEVTVETEVCAYEPTEQEKARLRILDKAREAKSCGGMKLACALYDEYLKDPVDEETKTGAMRELLDCCIAQKQTARAKELANSLIPRLDKEGSDKMRLLLRLLK